MYQLILVFFIITCITDGIYFLWLTLLLLFPPVLHLKDKEYFDDIDLHFFILIPCLNEEKVIYETVTNLLALNMPNTVFIVINDDSSDNTLAILEGIVDSRLRILNRVLPNAQKGKGDSLNDGCKYVKRIVSEEGIQPSKVVIGVMDADTFIKRSLLEKVAIIMNNEPKVGMVQARVRIGTSTRNYFLPLMQDLEFYTFINRMQNVREYTGTVAAAGNGQFNRLSAMETLGDGPWSRCLLEDFDFSLRLLLNGWRTRLVQDENIYQQGVISYKKFVKQRSRWAQGCIQCMPYIGKIIKAKYLSFVGKMEVAYFMMLPWLTLLSTAALFFSWFLIVYTYCHHSSIIRSKLSSYQSNELLTLLILILAFVFLPGIVFSISYWRDTKESFYKTLLAGLFIPIYNMMQIPAVLVATFRQASGRNSWIKTEHFVDSIKKPKEIIEEEKVMKESDLTDVNVNDNLMKGRTATIVIAGANATVEQKSWADGVCTGSSSNCVDDAQIQALINEAVANEFTSIYIQAFGTFWIGKPICIPYGLNFYVNGEGIPNVDFNIAICTTTPTAGTQFRSSAAWNTTPWYGTCNTEGTSVTKVSGTLPFDSNWVGQPIYINGNYNHVASVNSSTNTLTLTDSVPTQAGVPYYYSPSIFVRVNPNPAAGTINAKGQTRFENCALMPAFGDAAYTAPIYGLTDEYGANLRLDNFMFLPWGWFELGQPAIDQAKNVCMAFNCQGGNMGGGTDCTIGSIYIFAHGGAGPCWESIIGYDCVRVRKIMMYGCFRGISFQDAWLNEIDDLVVYAAQGLAVAFNTNDGHGNIIHRLNYESLGICCMSHNPLVYLYEDTYVQIDYFFNWPSTYSNNITAITNDDSRIERTCFAFNLGDSGIVQVVPRSVKILRAFGKVVSKPFLDSEYPSIGVNSGNLAVPTSGNTYYARNPVDITIKGGTGVSITCKDAQGNVIDDGVTSLNHRLLMGSMGYTYDYLNTGYSISVTYTTAPTVVVVQAEVGLQGTNSLPIAGVNYVASKIGIDISFSGGTGVAAKTMDGSTNTGGSVLDTGLTSMVGYHLSPGQIINFGDFTIAPSSLVVRRHSEL